MPSGVARRRHNFISEPVKVTQINSDSPSLQNCSVCFKASGRDGPRQRVTPEKKF